MAKRHRAGQGAVEEVVEGVQEGVQGGGLAALAQQAAYPLHPQQVRQSLHRGRGYTSSLFKPPNNWAAQLAFSKSATQVPYDVR